MSDLPLIGIMVMNRKNRKKTLQLYNNFKNGLNMDLFCFTPQDIEWVDRKIRGVSLGNNQLKTNMFRFPDAVYNRCYRKRAKTLREMEKHIGENKCFNWITRFNKWRIYNIMSNAKLDKYLPKTCLFKPETLMEQLNKERRLILKPAYGSLGGQIYLIELTDNHIVNIYRDTLVPMYSFSDKKMLIKKVTEMIGQKDFIIQREIQMAKVDGKMMDLRILVQKGISGNWEVTNGISKVAPYNFFVTNHCEKIYRMEEVLKILTSDLKKTDPLLNEIYEASIKTARKLEADIGVLGEIGIDMAIDNAGRIWIIEVNGRPQKNMYHKIAGNDDNDIAPIYQRPLEYAYYLALK
ncbi:YheC/YheD family protein [Bacillus sp. FJAT-27251]|uniref:YheC/YheD family endospore coat-associated protein n=1 Tax=Bacillus sp. FJAT-27251 TaxID=1684142 RepID=UPI0006A7CC55|nr:YheC/YheD family protein [Bacillus sp. FJAT-27251]